MCKACIDAVRETFPDVPESDYQDFLMVCTCYPFGGPDDVHKQLVELRTKTGDYQQCYRIADAEMVAEMVAAKEAQNMAD